MSERETVKWWRTYVYRLTGTGPEVSAHGVSLNVDVRENEKIINVRELTESPISTTRPSAYLGRPRIWLMAHFDTSPTFWTPVSYWNLVYSHA